MFLNRNFPNSIALALILILTALIVTACGGSSDSENQPTGRLSFQLQWDRTSSSRAGLERTGTDDCADVATVTAAAYDTSGGLLQTGGPWDCTDGQGILTQVPANRDVRVAIAGHDDYGTTLYRGESSGTLYLPGGGSVDAGLITAGSFAVTLTSPGDGDVVPSTLLTLAWNAVTGADHYVVQVADSYLFDAASIRQTLTVNASSVPSCQPDTAYMNVEGSYYWRVQVVDGAGNASNFSNYRGFYISDEVLTVNITSPAVSTVQLGDEVTFTASVTDPEGASLTESDLNYISWNSDVNGTLPSSGLSFTTSTLTGNDHTINLYVSEPGGNYGTASISLRVNNPPLANIIFPGPEYTHIFPMDGDLDCNGTATDEEDEIITATENLQWELLDAEGTTLGTANGLNPTFSVEYYTGSGIYTVTFTVTDSDGGMDTDSMEFYWGGA